MEEPGSPGGTNFLFYVGAQGEGVGNHGGSGGTQHTRGFAVKLVAATAAKLLRKHAKGRPLGGQARGMHTTQNKCNTKKSAKRPTPSLCCRNACATRGTAATSRVAIMATLTAQQAVDQRFRECHHDAQGGERAHHPRVASGWRRGWGLRGIIVGFRGGSCFLVG